MSDPIAIKPTMFELREARDTLDATARFVPVAADSELARLTNTREIVYALIDSGWLPPRFRTFTQSPDPETEVMVSGLDRPTPTYLIERSVAVLRKSAKYAGTQPNGHLTRLNNEREVLAALADAGWLSPAYRDHAAANYHISRDSGFPTDLATTVSSHPTAA